MDVSDPRNVIVAAALCALMLAPGAVLAQSGDTAGAAKPGSISVTTSAPEPEKWNAQKSADGTQRVFRCKPLACPESQTVSFRFSKSPVRSPDPKALERFATVDLPKSMRAAAAARSVMSDGDETVDILSSKTATLKGYPAVLSENKITRGKKTSYVRLAIIFAGPLMIRVQSSSPNQELAQRALDAFIEVMKIEEGPAAPRRPGPGTRSL